MDEIRVIGDEDYPEISKFPKEDDLWNANISNISELDHVVMAVCVSPAINILQGYPVIIVYPDTTRQDIIDDWRQICQYRDSLNNAQGVFSKSVTAVVQTVYRLHTEFKMSYLEIARFLNFEILVFLCAELSIVEEGETISTKGLILFFERFLAACGYTIDDVQAVKEKATNELSRGRLYWNLDSGPYSRAKIREMVRYFGKSVTDEYFTIDRRNDFLVVFCFCTNSRELVKKYYRRQYEVGDKEDKLLKKWERLITLIRKDFLIHQEMYRANLPDMG
jgi:hypothetical protein